MQPVGLRGPRLSDRSSGGLGRYDDDRARRLHRRAGGDRPQQRGSQRSAPARPDHQAGGALAPGELRQRRGDRPRGGLGYEARGHADAPGDRRKQRSPVPASDLLERRGRDCGAAPSDRHCGQARRQDVNEDELATEALRGYGGRGRALLRVG